MLCSLASHDSKFAEFDEEIRIMERLNLCRPTLLYVYMYFWNLLRAREKLAADLKSAAKTAGHQDRLLCFHLC